MSTPRGEDRNADAPDAVDDGAEDDDDVCEPCSESEDEREHAYLDEILDGVLTTGQRAVFDQVRGVEDATDAVDSLDLL